MIVPLSDRVLIQQDEQKKGSSLVVPEESKDGLKQASGIVLKIGPGVDQSLCPVQEGDRVYFNKFSGERIEGYLILKASEVLAMYVS